MRKGNPLTEISIEDLRAQKKGPLVVAHRGFSGRAPENTLAAFELALKSGADMIECDVRVTRDGEVVAFHDRTLDRTTNGKGRIENWTLKDLRKLDAGSWFDRKFSAERIPTLSEVLDLLKDRTFLNIELKADDEPSQRQTLLRDQVLHIVSSHDAEQRVFLVSFNHRLIREIKEKNPQLTTAIIFKATRDFASRPSRLVARACADAFVCGRGWLSKRFLQDLRIHRIPLFVYTINTEQDVRRMAKLGVDGVITNYPDLVVRTLR